MLAVFALAPLLGGPIVAEAQEHTTTWGRLKAVYGGSVSFDEDPSRTVLLTNTGVAAARHALYAVHRHDGTLFAESAVWAYDGLLAVGGRTDDGREIGYALTPDGRVLRRFEVRGAAAYDEAGAYLGAYDPDDPLGEKNFFHRVSRTLYNMACSTLGTSIAAWCSAQTLGIGTIGCLALGAAVTVLCVELMDLIEEISANGDGTIGSPEEPVHRGRATRVAPAPLEPSMPRAVACAYCP